jgi:nitroimidazol reductase NimA-like FMN-containing flavoprotein (pyridoxamine 5'-phosphate oxidase superfamily)
MIETLTAPQIESLLESQLVGRLACHAGGRTYVVPMSYAYDGTYIYAHAQEGMKVDMMRKNPEVCFQVDKMENMANWQSAIVWGTFEELPDKDERRIALQKLLDRVLPVISSQTTHLSPDWPFPPGDINSIKGVVFRIKIREKTGRAEKSTPETFFAS